VIAFQNGSSYILAMNWKFGKLQIWFAARLWLLKTVTSTNGKPEGVLKLAWWPSWK